MNWLNISTQTLDSENFIGSEPVERGTWLCLLRYCIGQENGGTITGCLDWPDRKWQQLVRITKEEVARTCDLWEWEGNSLIVWGYPKDKEAEVREKRERAKTNGAKGGRPIKTDVGNQKEPTLVISAKAERKGIRKEGEEEGNCYGVSPPSPKFEDVMKFAKGQAFPISQECAEAFFDEMEALQWTYKGQPCIATSAWHGRFRKWATNWLNNANNKNR